MSDENDSQDNNDGMPTVETMSKEWSRVMSNPDNLIVSDVLRSALPDEFSEGENVSSILEISIGIGELEIIAPLTRIDMSSTAWLVQMSVDASDAAVILSYTLEEIHESIIELRDKGNTITEFKVGVGNVSLSVDTDGRTYYITLTCDKASESADES